MIFSEILEEMEITVLSNMSQTEKEKYGMLSFL